MWCSNKLRYKGRHLQKDKATTAKDNVNIDGFN